MVKKRKDIFRIIFLCFILLILVINFTGSFFGLTHFYWHSFLHIGIIFFSFLIFIYSLKLNEKAMKYVIFGSIMLIITNCVLFLNHIFEQYCWLGESIFTFFGMILGFLLIMYGFKEAVNG